MKLKERIQGLASMPPVTVGEEQYTGSYLALMVAINPNTPVEEAARTPQLMAELGRIAAAAHRAKNDAEMSYRVWRDTLIHNVTNDLEEAKRAGFDCAVNPGVDSRGKDKPAKCPSANAAEVWMRTQAEYLQHYARINQAEEAWATIHAAMEAAQQRTWVIKTSDDNQKVREISTTQRIEGNQNDTANRRSSPPPPPPVHRR